MLRRSGSIPLLAAALLLAAGQAKVWASPPNESSAGERVETPRAEPQAPSEAPPASAPSEPPASPSPAPSEPEGRTAVPTGPDERGEGPNRQPPTRHSGGGYGSGSGAVVEDGSDDGSVYDNSQGAYSLPAPAPSPGGGGGLFHRGGRRHKHDGMGALDLDISPGRAQVFLNGQPIGRAGDFDGWPRYLWLPEGTYDLVFYLDGFQTLSRQVTVRPTLVMDMNDRLQPGRSIRPEDLALQPGG